MGYPTDRALASSMHRDTPFYPEDLSIDLAPVWAGTESFGSLALPIRMPVLLN